MEIMMIELMPQLLQGFGTTLKIFILTLIMSIPLGLIIALGRISKFGFIRWITGIYVLIMRGTTFIRDINSKISSSYISISIKLWGILCRNI